MSSSARTALLEPEALQADGDPARTWRSGLTTGLAVTAPVLFTLSNAVMPGLHGSTASVVAHIPAVADRLLATKLVYALEKTVRNNITALLAKTSLSTRPALIAFARDHGII